MTLYYITCMGLMYIHLSANIRKQGQKRAIFGRYYPVLPPFSVPGQLVPLYL